MFGVWGGGRVEEGVLWDCWGERGLEDKRADNATTYTAKYL